jgi:hypothetical protein
MGSWFCIWVQKLQNYFRFLFNLFCFSGAKTCVVQMKIKNHIRWSFLFLIPLPFLLATRSPKYNNFCLLLYLTNSWLQRLPSVSISSFLLSLTKLQTKPVVSRLCIAVYTYLISLASYALNSRFVIAFFVFVIRFT